MNRLMTILLALALVVVLVGPAQAVLIKNVTTGATVFYDNFEGVPLGDTPGPIAVIGTWHVGSAAPTVIRNDDPPGAFEGEQYLRWSNPSRITGEYSQPIPAGDELHFEAMFNAQNPSGARIWLGSGPWNGWTELMELFHASNNTLTANYGAATLGSLTIGAWHKIEIDYLVGASTYDAALNGAWTTGLPLLNPAPLSMNDIMLWDAGTAHNGLIDATPEPATLGVLLLGGLMSIVRRRR